MKKGMMDWTIRECFLFMIRFYQYTFSILIGPCCRFTPSCSSYALISIERFGVRKGILLTIKRLVKCHPLCPGGYDPVPEISKKF